MLWDECYMEIKQKWIETCDFESTAKMVTARLVWWSQSRWRAAGFLWSSSRDASGTRRTSNTNISCSSHRWTSPAGWRRGSSKSYRGLICSCRDCTCSRCFLLNWTQTNMTRKRNREEQFFQIKSLRNSKQPLHFLKTLSVCSQFPCC